MFAVSHQHHFNEMLSKVKETISNITFGKKKKNQTMEIEK